MHMEETRKRKLVSSTISFRGPFSLSALFTFLNNTILLGTNTNLGPENEERSISTILSWFYVIYSDPERLKIFRQWILGDKETEQVESKKSPTSNPMRVSSLVDNPSPSLEEEGVPLESFRKSVEKITSPPTTLQGSSVSVNHFYNCNLSNTTTTTTATVAHNNEPQTNTTFNHILLQQLLQQQHQQVALLRQIQSERSAQATSTKSLFSSEKEEDFVFTPSIGLAGGILSVSTKSLDGFDQLHSNTASVSCVFIGARGQVESRPLSLPFSVSSSTVNPKVFDFSIPQLSPHSEIGGKIQIKLVFNQGGDEEERKFTGFDFFTYLPQVTTTVSTNSSTEFFPQTQPTFPATESRPKRVKVEDFDMAESDGDESDEENSDSYSDSPPSAPLGISLARQLPTPKQLMSIRDKMIEFQYKQHPRQVKLDIIQSPSAKIVWKNRRIESPFKVKVVFENSSNPENPNPTRLLILALISDHKGKLQLDAAENFSEEVSPAGISLFSNLRMTKGTWGKEWNVTFVAIMRPTSNGFNNSAVVAVSAPSQIVVKTRKNPQVRQHANPPRTSGGEGGEGSSNNNRSHLPSPQSPTSNASPRNTQINEPANPNNSPQGTSRTPFSSYSSPSNPNPFFRFPRRLFSDPLNDSTCNTPSPPHSNNNNNNNNNVIKPSEHKHKSGGVLEKMASLLWAAELKQQQPQEAELYIDDDEDDDDEKIAGMKGSPVICESNNSAICSTDNEEDSCMSTSLDESPSLFVQPQFGSYSYSRTPSPPLYLNSLSLKQTDSPQGLGEQNILKYVNSIRNTGVCKAKIVGSPVSKSGSVLMVKKGKPFRTPFKVQLNFLGSEKIDPTNFVCLAIAQGEGNILKNNLVSFDKSGAAVFGGLMVMKGSRGKPVSLKFEVHFIENKTSPFNQTKELLLRNNSTFKVTETTFGEILCYTKGETPLPTQFL